MFMYNILPILKIFCLEFFASEYEQTWLVIFLSLNDVKDCYTYLDLMWLVENILFSGRECITYELIVKTFWCGDKETVKGLKR